MQGGPPPRQHLLGVKTEELGKRGQRDEKREEASGTMKHMEAA